MKVTGIILAGGKNLRMGQNKALLNINGQRIIDRIKNVFSRLFDEVLLVTNSPQEYLEINLRMMADLYPDRGALGGIFTGLFHASFNQTFVAACDMPFLNQALIGYLCEHAPDFDLVLPKTPDGLQPLHAVYSKRCLPVIEEMLQKNDLKISNFFQKVKLREVPSAEMLPFDPQLLSFLNINSPQDLRRAQATLLS